MSDLTSSEKKQWTEEERLALAAKMDAELDEFIDSLEKKRYSEGWPEDRWQEEMDKHPFFMKKTPQPGDDVHPMFEGLQKLKFDPEENTSDELALNYKEDGNFYMKHKKFRMAVYSFSEGIKLKDVKPEIMAILYNNRSAAQFFLQNYRSSFNDAQSALELKEDYTKARWRAAQCAFHLERFDTCSELCETILDSDPDNEEAKALLKKNKIANLETERNKRKEAAKANKRKNKFNVLCDVLKSRSIKFDDIRPGNPITEELLKPKFAPLEDFPVHLDEEDNETLIWPTAYSYPEFLITDFQQELSENVTMQDCLNELFTEPLPNNKNKNYQPNNINVYYENRKNGTVHKVDLDKSIREILNEKDFFVSGGSLLFYLLPDKSGEEREFLAEKRRPMVY